MVLRTLGSRSPDFDGLLVELGTRATGLMSMEMVDPDDRPAAETWLRSQLARAVTVNVNRRLDKAATSLLVNA